MRISTKPYLCLPSIALVLIAGPSASAATVTLNNWAQTGTDINNTFTANGTAGFTELFGTDTDTNKYDSGAAATFTAPVTLTTTGDYIQFSLTVGSITAAGPGSANAFRVGFENDPSGVDADATVHYSFGYGTSGTRRDVRFAGGPNNNEYSFGTQMGTTGTLTAAINELATGNTSNITVKLTYLGDAGGGIYNYQADVDWDGETHTSGSFTRTTNTWDKVYVNTNSVSLNVAGDTYTVNGVSVTNVPEPTAALLGGVGALLLLRRRRN
jgi:MYXO-CTERM domain-containing protein